MLLGERLNLLKSQDLKKTRISLILGSLGYAAWGYFIQHSMPSYQINYIEFIFLSLAMVLIAATSFVKANQTPKIFQLTKMCISLIPTIHTGYLSIQNGLAPEFTLGFLVVGGFVFNIINSKKCFIAYSLVLMGYILVSYSYFGPVQNFFFSSIATLTVMLLGLHLGVSRFELQNSFEILESDNSLILRNMAEGVLLIDDLETILGVNPSTEKILELSANQIVGKKISSLQLNWVNPDGSRMQTVDLPLIRCLKTGRPQTGVRIGIEQGSSKTKWITQNASPLLNTNSNTIKPFGAIVTFQDITELHEQQQTILDQQAQISTAAKLTALGEMASGIAHEINNPLAILTGRFSQIRKLIDPNHIHFNSITDLLKKCDETVFRISRIIRSMKSISRDSDSDPFEPYSMRALVEDSLVLIKERIVSYGITLKTDFDQDHNINCRPGQISQILLNLLQNSIDAIEGQPEKWIEIRIAKNEGTVSLIIKDSGKGIPESVAKRIMNPFFTTKEVGKGTGLGLSISRSLAKQHKGELFLNTNATNTEFILQIPASKQTVSATNVA